MEQLGAGSGAECVKTLLQSALELVGATAGTLSLAATVPPVTADDRVCSRSPERLRSASNMPARTH